MRKRCKQLFRRTGSAVLALLLLVSIVEAGPVTRAADDSGVDSPVIVKNSDESYGVTFNYETDAESVMVKGEFNEWGNNDLMTKNNGVWAVTLNLTGGTYGYKFYISDNDSWVTDPGNPLTTADGNSKLVLDERPDKSKSTDGTYTVTLRYADMAGTATSVEVRGLPDTTWSTGVAMRKTADGSNIWWTTIENVQPGSYEYKFVINGDQWTEDPANPAPSENQDGNSVLTLGESSLPDFVSPEVDGKNVTFRYYAPDAASVSLVGEMNSWNGSVDPLTKGDGGIWSVTKELAVGVYGYKFFVNGTDWETDQVNTKHINDDHEDVDDTNANSKLVVSGLANGSITVLTGGTTALPDTLKFVSESGATQDVTPTYELAESLTGVELTGSTIKVSNEYTGGYFTVTATYEGYTSEVTVNVLDIPAGAVVVMLHYTRQGSDYDGWEDAWIWPAGTDNGKAYSFTPDGDGVAAIIEVPESVTSLGYIIRKGGDNWEDKDMPINQFIDIPEMVSGIVHIYVKSGVKGYTKGYGSGAVVEHKPIKASCNADGTVAVMVSGQLDGDVAACFQITDDDNTAIAITGVDTGRETENSTWSYTLTISGEFVLGRVYWLIYGEEKFQIEPPNIYSTEEFEAAYTYTGNNLGATWTAEKTTFRVWAPTVQSLKVNFYRSGTDGTNDFIENIEMAPDNKGTWIAEKTGDLNGIYYTYTVEVNGVTKETVDPYARTTGVNGKRAMVIDLASTNPEGWDADVNPNAGLTYNDAVIYELHIRDLSSDGSSGIKNAGKFLGLTETGTHTPSGISTGLDHIKDLGVTHVHLLPVFDFSSSSVDETRYDPTQYNWGYDPVNYNAPEGSYSTDPYNGDVRVREMKQMVKTLHDNGISVIMDVVYNHVSDSETFSVNVLVPGYFSRIDDDGNYSNDSICGNDTASERSMVRKFIVDSVNYWADEYHIDGFRFDLVGLIDTQTINEIVRTVHKTHPDVIFYGEGWDMSTFVTKEDVTMATQKNSAGTPDFAYFNDTIRNALKGYEPERPGYVSGAANSTQAVQNSFMANPGWTSDPTQIINYASCHDDYTLFDHLTLSVPDASREELIRMNNLAAAIYLTAEGVPLVHAGEEMLRTKPADGGGFVKDSYNAPDSVNSIKWSTLDEDEYRNVYEYYKGLIAFRKVHGVLRLTSQEDILAHVTPVAGLPANVVAFEISGGVNDETADALYVVFNPSDTEQEIALPEGNWGVYINGEKAGIEMLETITDGTAVVAPISALVLVKESSVSDPINPDEPNNPGTPGSPSNPSAPSRPSGSSGNPPSSAPSNTPSTPSDSASGNPVEIPTGSEQPKNGSVSVDNSTAAPGQIVTVTVTPDEGFITGSITITDADDKTITVTQNEYGAYSFTMPDSGVTVNVEFVTPGAIFSDLDDNAWYRNSVAFVINAGLMNGTSTSTFAPNETTTRGMIATILYRLANEPSADPSAFNDVLSDKYYADAVAWTAANGVINGYGDGSFGPENAITRQDLAVMLWRYAGELPSTTSLTDWPDANDIDGYAETAIAWCVENGIINGSDGKLAPNGNATRSQVAAMVLRFCKNIAE